jgi:hypothetical protein
MNSFFQVLNLYVHSYKSAAQLSWFFLEKSNAGHSANRRLGILNLVTFSPTVHIVPIHCIFLPMLSSSTSCDSKEILDVFIPPAYERSSGRDLKGLSHEIDFNNVDEN